MTPTLTPTMPDAPPPVARAHLIDTALGDPRTADAPISFTRSIQLDENHTFPQREHDAVVATGLQTHYVPATHGGDLTDPLSLVLGVRAVARRDLTTAVAHGKTFLGAVCPWVAAPELARTVVAPMILAGDSVAWGLTERGRGSDLLATRTTARPDGTAWILDGEKWMVNNATRGRAMTVLARTGDTPGPRSLSLFFLDKHETDTTTLTPTAKIVTHGIRGADISGLTFDHTHVPPARLVGAEGEGLEIVLKSLQVTRTLCTALSLGAADTVIQAATTLATERRLYGRLLADLPAARETLADAVADLAVAESVALAGARHLQLLPQESALVSPVVKYLVPHLVDRMLHTLTQFLGARAVLTDGRYGQVQKAVRDHRIVGIFDGNSLVNLHAVVNEFGAVGRTVPQLSPLPAGLSAPACAELWRPDLLRLRTRTGSTLVRHLPGLTERAEDLLGPAGRTAARTIARRAAALARDVAHLPPQRHPTPERFRAAHEYAVVFATAAVLAHAVENDGRGGFWSGPGRLERALGRLTRLLDPTRLDVPYGDHGPGAAAAVDGLVDAARDTRPGRATGIFASDVSGVGR